MEVNSQVSRQSLILILTFSTPRAGVQVLRRPSLSSLTDTLPPFQGRHRLLEAQRGHPGGSGQVDQEVRTQDKFGASC